MKKFLIITTFLALGTIANAQDKLYADEFPLGDVTLLDGPLKKAQDLNVKTLLQYDCDRLLAPYRKEAGLEPKAPTYPNWDGLDGHVGGHYLTAMALNGTRRGSLSDRNGAECCLGQRGMPPTYGVYDQRIAGMCRCQQQEPSRLGTRLRGRYAQ